MEQQPAGREPFSLRSRPRWLLYLAIGLVAIGCCGRVYQVGQKVYWVDEAYTTLRMTGHTRTQLEQALFTGQVVSWADLQRYQRFAPDKGWGDTLHALQGNAEHSPLYFLLARGWSETLGYSVPTIRWLSVLFGLLVLPAVGWLAWELCESAIVTWLAMGLVALSPLFILYAQEARPYSLLTLLTAIAGATLLRAIRLQTVRAWTLYAVSVALGLYTQLLFGLVAVAHGLYVVLLDRWLPKRVVSPTLRAYGWASGAALLLFAPWLVVVISNFGQVQDATVSLTRSVKFARLFREWLVTFGRLWLDRDLKSWNLLLGILAVATLVYLCRQTHRRVWLFVLLLVLVPFLALAIPDLISGGQRSSRIRYLFPVYVGLQLALAYFLVGLDGARGWQRTVGRSLLALLVIGGIVGTALNSQATTWWNKSDSRSGYYLAAAAAINQAPQPLVISDGPSVDTIAFSYRLKPEVKFQLVRQLQFTPAAGFASVFLLNPSQALRDHMAQFNCRATPVPGTRSKSRRVLHNLWQCQP